MLIRLLLEEPERYRLLPGRKRSLGVVKLILPDSRKHIDVLRILVYLIAYIVRRAGILVYRAPVKLSAERLHKLEVYLAFVGVVAKRYEHGQAYPLCILLLYLARPERSYGRKLIYCPLPD